MSSEPQSILIVGAGELGLAAIEALTKHPKRQDRSIAVLLRQSTITSQDPAKQQQNQRLRALGVDLQPGDTQATPLGDLAATFRRHHTVVVCSGLGQPAGTQLRITHAMLLACEGDGVRRRYLPWQFGIDYDVIGSGSSQDLFDEQLEIRALLRGQESVDWNIVSTGLFMSFLFLPDFGAVDLGGRVMRGLGGWDTRVTLTTARDIGVMVAEVVLDPRDDVPRRGVVYVAGDTVTYGRVAELVERRFGGGGAPFRREVWDLGFLRGRLAGRPDDGMVKYQNVFAGGRGTAWDKSETLNARRGIVLQDLEGYLESMDA